MHAYWDISDLRTMPAAYLDFTVVQIATIRCRLV